MRSLTLTLIPTSSILTPILDHRIAHLQDERDLSIQSLRCETLCAQGRIVDAAEILIKITNALGQLAAANAVVVSWVAGEFRRRKLEKVLILLPRVYSSLCIVPGNNGRQGIGRQES